MRKIQWKYDIGVYISDAKRDLVIIDREIRQETYKNKNGKIIRCRKQWYKYKCNKCGYEGWAAERSMNQGYGCSCCASKVVVPGINDIASVAPWMVPHFENQSDATTHTLYCNQKLRFKCLTCGNVKLSTPYDFHKSELRCSYCDSIFVKRPDLIHYLYDKEDALSYTLGSNQKIKCKCPFCGDIQEKQVYKLVTEGFSCKKCSDHLSYPNKFLRCLINQLPAQNIDFEYSPVWLNRYSYDCYFTKEEKQYVIEMDGGIGHGKRDWHGKTDVDGLVKDQIKDNLAAQNDVNVIRIDCDYGHSNRYEFIKRSVLQSDLSSVFDLSSVNWEKCDSAGINNFVYDVCKYWDTYCYITTRDVAQFYNLHPSTVCEYLKMGCKHGWCIYNPTNELRKAGIRSANRRDSISQINFDVERVIKECLLWLRNISHHNCDKCDSVIVTVATEIDVVIAALCLSLFGRHVVKVLLLNQNNPIWLQDNLQLIKSWGVDYQIIHVDHANTAANQDAMEKLYAERLFEYAQCANSTILNSYNFFKHRVDFYQAYDHNPFENLTSKEVQSIVRELCLYQM